MKDKISDDVIDLNKLLHPADAFDHPTEVMHDPDLTRHLASWAPDACACETAPELRDLPRGRLVS